MREILKTQVLLVGYGQMGRIHAKYLRKLGVNFSIYDPFSTKQNVPELLNVAEICNIDLSKFTHSIIASPDHIHIINYKQLRGSGFDGKILIEKPAFINDEDLKILQTDNKICVGLVERYNQAIESLKSKI